MACWDGPTYKLDKSSEDEYVKLLLKLGYNEIGYHGFTMPCWDGQEYKLDKSENFDEYMKELGVGMVLRKMANTLTVEVLRKKGDVFTFTTCTTFKISRISFKLGEEFDEETLDGRKVKSVCTLDGDKLVQEQKGDKPCTIVREFTDSEMTTTITLGDIKCVRVYKAVQHINISH